MSRARDLANLGDGIDATQITSGQFDDNRIKATNVTQHEGSIDALASNPTVTLGSNATFPTGHIVSSSFATAPNSSDFLTSSNSYNEVSSYLRVTITPTSPNKVLLMVNGGNPRMPSGFSMFCSWGIINASNGTLLTGNLANTEGLENIRGGMNSSDTDFHSGGHSFSFLHTPSSYGSPIIYTPVFKSQNNGSNVYFTEGANNVQYVMSMAFEIKQ